MESSFTGNTFTCPVKLETRTLEIAGEGRVGNVEWGRRISYFILACRLLGQGHSHPQVVATRGWSLRPRAVVPYTFGPKWRKHAASHAPRCPRFGLRFQRGLIIDRVELSPQYRFAQEAPHVIKSCAT